MLTLFLFLLICIFASCFFSGSETGFISWNPLKVVHASAKGSLSARIAMYLMKHRERVITTVLICNNVCNIGAAFIFIKLFTELDAYIPLNLSAIPSPESFFLTPVMVLFSEILPKSLYRIYPYKLTIKSIPFLGFFYLLLSPLFWIFGGVSRIWKKEGERGSGESYSAKVREDIVLVAVEGARRGTLFESADDMLENTLGMKGKSIGTLCVTLDEWKKTNNIYSTAQPLSALFKDAPAQADEIVVFDGGGGTPVGYVPLLDAAFYFAESQSKLSEVTLSELVKPMPRFKHSMEILSCLRRLPPDSPRYCAV
ncbi:MAG: DUF21 domain-containing protein, partial [Chitinispirillales bacterium]|nr:DUF21 domain-containing protein [Chitinispirillales bacterium]